MRSWRFLIITVGFPVTFYMLFLGGRRASEIVSGSVTWRDYLMVSMCSFGSLVAGLTAGGGRLAAERASGWARQLRISRLHSKRPKARTPLSSPPPPGAACARPGEPGRPR